MNGLFSESINKKLTLIVPIGIIIYNILKGKIINNRDNILESTLKLFTSRGYDAVGVKEIAEAAKVTKPTLYHYFGSKKGLLDALLKEYDDEFYNNILQAANYQRDITQNLNRLAFAFADFAKKHEEFYRMQLAMYFSPPDSEANHAAMRFNTKIYECIEELFIKASDDYGNMKGRHKAYAATFIGMLNTYIGLSLNGFCKLDNELIYQAVHQFMHGLFS